MNDLLRGRVSRFSLDALVNIATAMGREVRLELHAAGDVAGWRRTPGGRSVIAGRRQERGTIQTTQRRFRLRFEIERLKYLAGQKKLCN